MILFGLRDIGSANACFPVIKMLKDADISVSVYAEGPVYERFKDEFLFFSDCGISDLLDLIKPSLVVTTCAIPGGSVPITLTREAKKINLRVVLIEEMWAGHSAFTWNIMPDGVCVCDEFAKRMILKSWSGYFENNVYITGSPVFDKFVDVDTSSAGSKLCVGLNLSESWPVVFFPATGLTAGMRMIVRMIVDALNNLDMPVYFILKDHPSVSGEQASEYRGELENLKVGQVIDPAAFTSNEINAGSDIVVGTFSTMTVEACYMRKPVLIISTEEINQLLSESTHNALRQWPLIDLGAAFKAGTVKETTDGLAKILRGDIMVMRYAQEQHFKTDGLSAGRVAETILKYYRC